MNAISSFASGSLKGVLSLPLSFGAATLVTAGAQLAGLRILNTAQVFNQNFQSFHIHEMDYFLPSLQPHRIAAFTSLTVITNYLISVGEEFVFRFVFQDKMLTCLMGGCEDFPENRRVVKDHPQVDSPIRNTAIKITKIAVGSFLFAFHKFSFVIQVNEGKFSDQAIIGRASASFFTNLGVGLIYGAVYEKNGLAASISANAVWNTLLWFWLLDNWKLPSKSFFERLLSG